MAEHARGFGLETHEFQPVAGVRLEADLKVVWLENGREVRAPALILATGGLPRHLGVPGEEALIGLGVSYCAVCDGPFFKGRELAVVGAGDRLSKRPTS
jgi:thioredoxin reductase (NADPH)